MANISFRTDDQTKTQAAELFRDLGLDMSTAINMFLRQSIASNGIQPTYSLALKPNPAPELPLIVSLS